jgi:nitrogen regulatory protein P-II 1
MKKIEAVIRLTKLDAVVDALVRLGVAGMTLTQVRGSGRQQGHCELYRGSVSAVHLVTKVKIEMLVLDAWVEKVLKVLQTTARTGRIGDGKIFVRSVAEVVQIRTGERGERALCSSLTEELGSS